MDEKSQEEDMISINEVTVEHTRPLLIMHYIRVTHICSLHYTGDKILQRKSSRDRLACVANYHKRHSNQLNRD